MSKHSKTSWPPLKESYEDEFGKVEPEVYEAAAALWLKAKSFALRILHDGDAGRTLLLKAAAMVSRRYTEDPERIKDLQAYLFQTYKRVVLAELETINNRRRFQDEAGRSYTDEYNPEVLERRILLNEVVKAMDEWTRSIFEWLTLDYSFEEIGRHLGLQPRLLRNKYNRRINQLIKDLSAKSRTTERFERTRGKAATNSFFFELRGLRMGGLLVECNSTMTIVFKYGLYVREGLAKELRRRSPKKEVNVGISISPIGLEVTQLG